MAMIGKLAPARPCAFSRSLARWVISSAISPLRTECLDILSPPPGTSEVINQVERDNSRDTKIAARLTCMATRPGRGPHAGIVASYDWLAAAPYAAPAALHRPIGSLRVRRSSVSSVEEAFPRRHSRQETPRTGNSRKLNDPSADPKLQRAPNA